jgi:hypothetical protein
MSMASSASVAVWVPAVAGRGALSELTQVDWRTLGETSGEIPGLLRGLLSRDDETREEAYHGLLHLLCHQGSIVPATAHAVPFLAAMLADLRVGPRGRIAALLVLCGAAALRQDDDAALATRRALAASAKWLALTAQLGPELVQEAAAALSSAAAGHALAAGEDLALRLEGLDQADDASSPWTAAQARRMLSELASAVAGQPFHVQANALSRAQEFAKHAPRLALLLIDAIDDPDVLARRAALARTVVLAHAGRSEEALATATALVNAWLAPPTPGALNQYVERAELLEALELLGAAAGDLRERVERAPPVEVALPDGDFL